MYFSDRQSGLYEIVSILPVPVTLPRLNIKKNKVTRKAWLGCKPEWTLW